MPSRDVQFNIRSGLACFKHGELRRLARPQSQCFLTHMEAPVAPLPLFAETTSVTRTASLTTRGFRRRFVRGARPFWTSSTRSPLWRTGWSRAAAWRGSAKGEAPPCPWFIVIICGHRRR